MFPQFKKVIVYYAHKGSGITYVYVATLQEPSCLAKQNYICIMLASGGTMNPSLACVHQTIT